ncbi:MAG TPA: hypothetical protein VIL72_09340 [Beijerinckiaceae bacterium]|jgi:hypothetical protein
MTAKLGEKAMIGFIVAIIVMGLFGPWLISLLLAIVCGGCWWATRGRDVAPRAGTRTHQRRPLSS